MIMILNLSASLPELHLSSWHGAKSSMQGKTNSFVSCEPIDSFSFSLALVQYLYHHTRILSIPIPYYPTTTSLPLPSSCLRHRPCLTLGLRDKGLGVTVPSHTNMDDPFPGFVCVLM